MRRVERRRRSTLAPPECLRTRGITHAVEVSPPPSGTPAPRLPLGRLLWLIYGPQLRERFMSPKPAAPVHPATGKPPGARDD